MQAAEPSAVGRRSGGVGAMEALPPAMRSGVVLRPLATVSRTETRGRCRLILFTSNVFRAPDFRYVSEKLLYYSICSISRRLQSRPYGRAA